ncbi:MAG TPA: peroxiredoxin [Myxococcaceae bacterium]|nr:peroxiredoxin [Myxococcaceae bacterium]
MIQINAPAPDFSARTTDGKNIRLSDFRGKKVVLYFFPKAFTPGCTHQAKTFVAAYPEIEATGATLLGVSTDDFKTQCDFTESLNAPFPMIADQDGSIARSYDIVWPLLKMVQRVTFVIDEEGIIRGAFHFEMRIGQHAKSVVHLLKAMGETAKVKPA